jgi:hypothetical protein
MKFPVSVAVFIQPEKSPIFYIIGLARASSGGPSLAFMGGLAAFGVIVRSPRLISSHPAKAA